MSKSQNSQNISDSSTIGGNTSNSNRSRAFTFTLNNWTSQEYENIIKFCKDAKLDYIIGEEIGTQSQIPHLQGYIYRKNQIEFNMVKKAMPRAHIEKARKDYYTNFKYCSKDGKYVTNMDIKLDKSDVKSLVLNDEYNNVVWKPWQKDILDLLETKPDSRKIHWYWESTGNVGKSYLLKYIALTNKGVIIADGKKDNIFNQIFQTMEAGIEPSIIILDIPRTQKDFVNYTALEQIKTGMIYSGKYEGGQCIFRYPHVIIVSNNEPNYEAFSQDRYHVVNIT